MLAANLDLDQCGVGRLNGASDAERTPARIVIGAPRSIQHTNPLDMQDEVTTRLAHEIHIELIAAESRRAAREHPDQLDSSITLFTVGLPVPTSVARGSAAGSPFFRSRAPPRRAQRRALLGLADTHMSEVNMYSSDDRAGQIRAAEAAVTEGVGAGPDNAKAHVTYGTVLYAMCAPERALREFNWLSASTAISP